MSSFSNLSVSRLGLLNVLNYITLLPVVVFLFFFYLRVVRLLCCVLFTFVYSCLCVFCFVCVALLGAWFDDLAVPRPNKYLPSFLHWGLELEFHGVFFLHVLNSWDQNTFNQTFSKRSLTSRFEMFGNAWLELHVVHFHVVYTLGQAATVSESYICIPWRNTRICDIKGFLRCHIVD